MLEFIGLDALSLQILGHVAIAVFFGAVIGLERELSLKPAGLRTHMLVSGASALLAGVNRALFLQYTHAAANVGGVQSDPLRIIEAVVTGVTFLGAGTILRHAASEKVEGLTTAGSLLLAAVIGLTVSSGRIALAGVATLIGLAVLAGMKPFERWLQTLVRKRTPGDQSGDHSS